MSVIIPILYQNIIQPMNVSAYLIVSQKTVKTREIHVLGRERMGVHPALVGKFDHYNLKKIVDKFQSFY